MLLRVLALTVSLVLLCTASAVAALGDGVAAGRQIAAQIDTGTTSCAQLSGNDFQHLGEYAMERMLGVRGAYEAMNDRMTSVLGSGRTEQMRELMGRRVAGCARAGTTGRAGTMMDGRDLAWMRDGTWRHMSRADWQHVNAAWTRPSMHGDEGWSAGTVIALVLAVAVSATIVAFVAGRRRSAE